MKTRRILYPVILGLIAILLPIALGACSALLPVGVNSGSSLDVQSQVNTQVAATLVGYLVQTKVAENLTSVQVTQAAALQQAPTATPAPTETPLPSPTPIPPTVPPPPPTLPPTAPAAPVAAAVVSVPAPEISANVNTNCRQGPSIHYRIAGYLMVGAVSYVYGRDYSSKWWYIQNPNNKSGYCWVWSESTTVRGDASGVTVVSASEYAEADYNNWFASQYYGEYGNGYYYNGNCCQPYYSGGKVYCYPTNWWNCNSYWPNSCSYWPNNCYHVPNNCYHMPNNCKCKNPWSNTCNKKPVCPLPNGNFANYCLQNPGCCGSN
jgi:hypothetical protein